MGCLKDAIARGWPDWNLQTQRNSLASDGRSRHGADPSCYQERNQCRGRTACGLKDQLGSIAAGKLADNIAVPGDPQTIFDNWSGVDFAVMKDGERIAAQH